MYNNMYDYQGNQNYVQPDDLRLRPNPNEEDMKIKMEVSNIVRPLAEYGLKEKRFTSFYHALMEVSAISYLMGKGYDSKTAHRIVESWEINEKF